MKKFAIFFIILTACFAAPLYALAQFSLHNDFFSYIPLIPVITLYLIWSKKTELPASCGSAWPLGAVVGLAGLGLLVAAWWITHSGRCDHYWTARDMLVEKDFRVGWIWGAHPEWKSELQDYLTLMTASYLCLLWAGCLALFGRPFLKAVAFPLAFLVFMIPLPALALDETVIFFQHTSAVAALVFLKVCGMTVFLEDLMLHLPGFGIIVAPECCGIHSTVVLLITAVLAAWLFLESGWKRALLVVLVLPLAILRNGFRIFVISELCVHISHDMINSPIHRKGGPIFFALSLIPFFALLIYLRKTEPPAAAAVNTPAKA